MATGASAIAQRRKNGTKNGSICPLGAWTHRTVQYPSWMNEESWMKGQQTYPLTIHFNMWTVSSDVSIQRRHWQPLSVHLWAYCTHPTHDVNDMICEDWPQHQRLRPLLFSNSGVGSFTSHIDCKTVGFFLKISTEIGEAWRTSLTRASLTRP